MSEYIPVSIRRLVRERANQTCEYSLIHEVDALLPHEPDHIIAAKHRGETTSRGLALLATVPNRAI